MRTCLVVGGGFLGGHIARCLADRGHRVTVFSRNLNPWLNLRSAGIDIQQGDVEQDGRLLLRLVDDAEVILHFASSSKPPTAAASPILDLEQTIRPALLVMEAVKHAGLG